MSDVITLRQTFNDVEITLSLEIYSEEDIGSGKNINYFLAIKKNEANKVKIKGELFSLLDLGDFIDFLEEAVDDMLEESLYFKSVDGKVAFYFIADEENSVELVVDDEEVRVAFSKRESQELLYFIKLFLISRNTKRIFYTKSKRPITYYVEDEEKVDVKKLNILFVLLMKSWRKETSYPACQRDENFDLESDPSYGQCAVSALIVHDYFGGDIYKIRNEDGSTHYFNMINGSLVDMSSDQFSYYNIGIDYNKMQRVSLDYFGKSEDTKKRYLILKENLRKNIEASKK